jgi:hypothetical protein
LKCGRRWTQERHALECCKEKKIRGIPEPFDKAAQQGSQQALDMSPAKKTFLAAFTKWLEK